MFTAHSAQKVSANFPWMAQPPRLSTPSKTLCTSPSIAFHCFRKTSSPRFPKTSRLRPRSRELQNEPIAQEPRKMRNFFHSEWETGDRACPCHGAPPRRSSPRAWINRNERRLRRRRVRLLLRFDRRNVSE